MPGDEGDGFMLDDRERLPWLEPAEPYEEIQPVPIQKVIALVLLGLILLAVIVGGGWWLKSRMQAPQSGDVAVISPPSGDYKIPANSAEAKKYNVDGKTFEGEGDAAYEASGGGNSAGRIDPTKAPEVPMTEVVKSEPKPPPPPKPAPSDTKPAAAPTPAPTPAVSIGAARIQIGAYNSKDIAEEAWKRLLKRFDDLSGAKHAVEPVVSGGKTLYRLRMGAADKASAAATCGRLRVAGENCFVVP